jgi:ADP-ribose pyrophosphatase YjhB (NUDIX family)
MKKYAGVLLKNRNKVLLCKRAPGEIRANTWSIPCGHIEEDEKPKDAAIREFKEETNINLDTSIKLLDFIKTENDNGIIFVFFKEVEKEIEPDLEKAKDGHEHTKCGYFNLIDIPIKDKKDDLYKIISKIV